MVNGGCNLQSYFNSFFYWSLVISFFLGLIFNSWDEWVGTERLLKLTDENVERQKALEKQAGDKNVKPRSSHNKPKGSNG